MEGETITIEKKEEKSLNVDLSNYEATAILGLNILEPIVIYVDSVDELKNRKTIGIPGFFNKNNEDFFLLDGSPCPVKDFYDVFARFLDLEKKKLEAKN